MSAEGNIPQSFWALVERYRVELVNQALAILGRIEDAEDVVQESFCEAFRNQEQLARVRSIRAWLRAVNRANALDRLRARRRDQKKTERKHREAPARAVTSGGFTLLELRESVAQAIETLPPKMRAVVLLRYWEHLSYEEIADRLGITQSAVWHLLHDASMKMHGKLKGYMEAPAEAPPPSETSLPSENAKPDEKPANDGEVERPPSSDGEQP